MSFVLASAARATTGARAGQEDAFRLWPAEGVARPNGKGGGLLAVLADGMGGHTGGAVAGQTACSTFAEVFSAATTPYEARLQSALDASNEALAKGVEQNAALKGMGCTLIGAWMDEVGLRWTSVGDSLLLLYRFPDVMRLNADHSLGSFLDEQARQNRITFSEAKQHHNRNALRSALTGSKIDLVDLRGEPLELRAGDWILLASDGICSLEGDEIADVVYNFRESTPAQMADGLIAAVVKKAVAGQDNTTVVAVRVDEASDASDAVTTRVMRRPGEEQELRSRRIGITGRSKTSPPKRSAARSVRSAVWLVAAAIFFLIFAATVLLRALQPAAVPASGTAAPPRPLPAAVTAPAPEPATADTPGPDGPKGSRPPAGEQPKSATPDAGPPVPVKPPAPQRARPQPPSGSPSGPPAAQPPGPSQPPGAQSGEVQEQRDVQPSKAKQQQDDREVPVRRVKRPERQAKENFREQPPKEALKSVIKSAPPAAKEGPTNVPRPAQSLPWGFGGE
jgi:serine/threonine protein phosphatase PrpC